MCQGQRLHRFALFFALGGSPFLGNLYHSHRLALKLDKSARLRSHPQRLPVILLAFLSKRKTTGCGKRSLNVADTLALKDALNGNCPRNAAVPALNVDPSTNSLHPSVG
jgi:hypothetical protein